MTRITKTSSPLLNWASFRDLVAVVAVLVIVKQSLLPLTQLYAGPVSTLSAMILATILLKRCGSEWSALGFRWPKSWLNTAGLTVSAWCSSSSAHKPWACWRTSISKTSIRVHDSIMSRVTCKPKPLSWCWFGHIGPSLKHFCSARLQSPRQVSFWVAAGQLTSPPCFCRRYSSDIATPTTWASMALL